MRVATGHDDGGIAGRIYRFVGPFGTSELANKLTLSTENYGDETRWALESETSVASVEAIVRNSSVSAAGLLKLSASADQRIRAVTAAGSAAVAGGIFGAGVSGAGASATNTITTNVTAAIDGVAQGGIAADSIEIAATDTSSITAITVAVSLAASFAIGGAVSLAVALSRNTIRNDVAALVTVGSGRIVTATDDSVTVAAVSRSHEVKDGDDPLELTARASRRPSSTPAAPR